MENTFNPVATPSPLLMSILAKYPPIETVTLSHVPTAPCAAYLNRKSQTLRIWACHENGPIRPIRVNGRLAWPVAEIKRILGVAA